MSPRPIPTPAIAPPHSLEAEQAVLGGLMLDNSTWKLIDGDLKESDFHREDHRLIFRAIQDLATLDHPCDLVTVGEWLERENLLPSRVEFAYLGVLARDTPSAANVRAYADIVRERAIRRELLSTTDKIAELARDPAGLNATALLDAAWKRLDSIQSRTVSNRDTATFRPFTEAEINGASLHPKCIVENYLYADVGQLCAAGGTGKSTLLIHEAVCIAIGRDLWGQRILNPGRTLIVTAEDSRELFAARLREVIKAMDLNGYERRLALDSIAVWDVSGSQLRLAELDQAGNIRSTRLADNIITANRNANLAQVVFDPQISFGPGERMINDGGQALVTEARKIRNALTCMVRFSHHTGKANARNGAADQYAGRGDTSMPDGSRMVTILNAINGDQHGAIPPAGFALAPGETGFIMTRPKLSYAPPQPTLWIRRHGFAFEHFTEEQQSAEQILTGDAANLLAFLADELAHGRKHTSNTLENTNPLKLSRARLRGALASLQVTGQIVERDLPKEERHGRRCTFLDLIRHSAAIPPFSSAD